MEVRFKKHIETHFSFFKDNNLLVACSGGLDSVVLAHLLNKLRYEIGLAHCNFKLRGEESDGDAAFVTSFAARLEIPCFKNAFDTKTYATDNKVSTQMAARDLRYAWFGDLLATTKYDYILTAHHADDALETFFINLSRGTGLKGLTGIPAVNDKVIRPLLDFSRKDITEYAKREGLYWREDSSNAKSDYLRNAIRHQVIPSFKEVSPSNLQNFSKTQSQLQGSRALIEDYMALIYNLVVSEVPDGYQLNIQKLQELPNTDALLYELLSPFGFTAWEDVSKLLEAQSGKQIFSETHRLLKDRDVLLLTKNSQIEEEGVFLIPEGTTEVNLPIHLNMSLVERFEITNSNTVFVDVEKLNFPLALRKWNEGDVFQPFGMEGKKKLSKFFKDEKLSLVAKENVWVLCDQEQIVWVVGLRLDDRFKVSKQAKSMLRIDYTPM